MSKMGLGRKLVNLIMYCVKSVSYAVLINGEPLGNVLPSRGISQGDRVTPSPFLFLFCTECLIEFLERADRMKEISGVKISRHVPLVSHILFAADSLLFCKTLMEENRWVQKILKEFA